MPIIRFTGVTNADGSSAGLPILMRNRRLLTQFETVDDGYLYVAHATDFMEFDALGVRYEQLEGDELQRALPEDGWTMYQAFRQARPDVLDSDMDIAPLGYEAAHFFIDAPERPRAAQRIAAYDRDELQWRGGLQGLLWRPGGITPNLNGSWRHIYPPEAGWTAFIAVPQAQATDFCEMLVNERLSGHDDDHAIAIGTRVVKAR